MLLLLKERNSTIMEHYYQPEIECASRDQIRAWQDERLAKTVKRVYENVAFYRNKMDQAGIKPDDVQSLDDLHKLPFLTKDDLRDISVIRLCPHPVYQRYDRTQGCRFL